MIKTFKLYGKIPFVSKTYKFHSCDNIEKIKQMHNT